MSESKVLGCSNVHNHSLLTGLLRSPHPALLSKEITVVGLRQIIIAEGL